LLLHPVLAGRSASEGPSPLRKHAPHVHDRLTSGWTTRMLTWIRFEDAHWFLALAKTWISLVRDRASCGMVRPIFVTAT
jgi:hypothetical protein